MAYKIASGPQLLGQISLTDTYFATPPGGMIPGQEVEGIDPTNKYWGKFKLLYGVASNVIGALVSYDASTGLTTLSPTSGNSALPLAVSMAANTSVTTLSWYQISGVATIKKTAVTVSPNVKIYLSATAGRIKVVQSAGLQILGARSSNAATVTSTTSTVLVTIGPSGMIQQGQIT